ncbi:MAG TPA: ribonuclease HII [Alphaproteobacteria bacterium]|nr:ribonuclease HII [Alphaproteobacteria bacterium]
MPDLALERAARALVCGVDEAGRGPWAGPVLAAAVMFAPALPDELVRSIDDSKKLSPARREQLLPLILSCARVGVGAASVEEIDAFNILEATMKAMARAVRTLNRSGPSPELALIDGNRAPALPCPARAVVRGDGSSLSIAAASIVAKVSRDRLMRLLARRHPGYGWERNMGYGTPEHREALARLGPNPFHRRSFAPIHAYLSNT